MTKPTFDLDAYDAEESREENAQLAGMTPAEKRQIKRELECASGGHTVLAAVWRTLTPSVDRRLHATCPVCRAHVSRSAFVN